MHILVTGAAGFIGRELTRLLLQRGAMAGRPIASLTLVDLAPIEPPAGSRDLVHRVRGDASTAGVLASVTARPLDLVFALGATLTTEAERDIALGYEVNLLGTLRLLDALRLRSPGARLVFASSIAVFGGALPESVDETVMPQPQTSYGSQKAMVELLLADHARRRLVDGRALRLPIVVFRPGAPAASVSDRVAAIVREPLRGVDVTCPIDPQTLLPLASVAHVARSLVALAEAPAPALPASRAVHLPAFSATPRQLVEALPRLAARRAWSRPLGRVRFEREAAVQAIVDGWPKRFVSRHAQALGLAAESSLDPMIDALADALDPSPATDRGGLPARPMP